jgi:hypothetical protein
MSLEENLAKAISKLRKKNSYFFLPYEDILELIKQSLPKDPALQILIPDYSEFIKICSRPVDSAQHESMVVMGIRNQDLEILLNAVRRFIVDNKDVYRARRQYVADLSELNWWRQRTEVDRYREGNRYKGRIYELLLANWLSDQGYQIINLEAWESSSPDIVVKKAGVTMNVQVKYIAQYKKDFEQDVRSSLAPSSGFIDCDSASKNFMEKLDERGQQLRDSADGLRVAVIVIDNREIGAYFIEQENCCRNAADVMRLNASLYARKDIDEVWIYTHQGLKIKPLYRHDIRMQVFVKC